MITIGLIALLILIALVLILVGAGGFLLTFGWILFILADIGLAVWLIGKIVKKLFKK